MHARREVSVDGRPVSYLEWTPPEGIDPRGVLVLLHGGGLDSAELSWGDFGGRVASAGYRVLAPDAPGYGHTPLPPWPSTQDNLLRYAAGFIDALALDGFVLGGLSMGGGMTLGYALEHPDRVCGIVAMGSAGMMERQAGGRWGRLVHLVSWASVRSGLMAAAFRLFLGNRRLTAWSLESIVRDPARRTPALLDAVMAESARAGGATAFTQWQRDQILPGRMRTNYLPRASALTMPALVVHGERDTGVPLERASELAAALPDADLVVAPGAGHWVPRDAPDLVADAVVAFLDRALAPRAT